MKKITKKHVTNNSKLQILMRVVAYIAVPVMLLTLAACGEGGDASDIWQASGVADSSLLSDSSAYTESDGSSAYEPSATEESSVVEESNESSIEESSEAEESQEESSDVQDELQYSLIFELVSDAVEISIDDANFCIYKAESIEPTVYAMVHKDDQRHTDFVYIEYQNMPNKKRVLMKKEYMSLVTNRLYYVVDVYDYDANLIFSFKCSEYYILYDDNIAVFPDYETADIYTADGNLILSESSFIAINELELIKFTNSGGLYILQDLNGKAYCFPEGYYMTCFEMNGAYIVLICDEKYNLIQSMTVLCDKNGKRTLGEYDMVTALDKYGENIEKLLNDFLVALRADDYDAMRKYATEKLINDYKLYESTFPDGGADNKTGEAVYSLRCTMPEFHYTIFPRNISGALYVENETKGQFLYGFQVTTDDPHLDKQYLWLATVSDGKGGLLIDSMSFGYVAGGALMHRED